MNFKANEIKKFEKLNDIELPNDNISESGLIGTLLIHPEFILNSDYIKPHMFYERALGSIYHIISELYKKGIVEIDDFLIINEIEGNKSIKNIFDDIPNISDPLDYLENLKLIARNTVEEYELLSNKVVTASFKRESYIKLKMLSTNILESKEDINDINYNLQQEVADFSKIYICNREILTLGEQVDKIWENIVSKRNNGFFGFPSKFEIVNEWFTYEKTELVMIGAPAKTGKSQFLSNEAWHKAISGVPTLYIDREMSTENHTLRLLSYLTGIENKRIKNGKVSLIEDKMIEEKRAFIKKLPFIHLYKPTANLNELYMDIKSLQLKHGIEFSVLDYVKANDGSDSDKEYQKLGKITDWFKNEIAGSLNMACLSACQMDDNGTKVADSQKIFRNCSTLAYLTNKTKEEIVTDGKHSGNMKLRVKGGRNGEFMYEDQYINLLLNGNICTLKQAKTPFHEGGELPY